MKELVRGLGLTIATLVVLTGAFEAYLAVRFGREHAKLAAEYEGRELCTRAAADRRLVYEFVPGRCGMNALGFDDVEHPFEKAPGLFRIVVIGDSVAQGQGVAREERFGNVLAGLLDANSSGRYEVINLARTGYSTAQELVVLEDPGLRFRPDLVLWSYVLNDPADPVFHDANGELGRYFYRPRWRGRHYVERKLFEARERRLARHCGREFHTLLHCAYRDRIAGDFARLGTMARANGFPVVLLVHPVLEEGGSFDDYGLRSIHGDLATLAADAGLVAIDLVAAHAGTPSPALAQRLTDRFDPWHPNALGHAQIARYVAAELDRRGLLRRDVPARAQTAL